MVDGAETSEDLPMKSWEEALRKERYVTVVEIRKSGWNLAMVKVCWGHTTMSRPVAVSSAIRTGVRCQLP